MILLEHLLEKAFTIPGDTAGGFPGFHLVGKGEAQIALEIPRKLIVLFLGERVVDSKSVLWPIIKADRRLKFVRSASTFLDTYGRHAHVSLLSRQLTFRRYLPPPGVCHRACAALQCVCVYVGACSAGLVASG